MAKSQIIEIEHGNRTELSKKFREIEKGVRFLYKENNLRNRRNAAKHCCHYSNCLEKLFLVQVENENIMILRAR